MKRYFIPAFLLLSISGLSQTLMTVEQVYNYNIGDIFIMKGGGIYSPPTYTTTTITNKYYSPLPDTVFYTADIFEYTPQACPNCTPTYDTTLNATLYYYNLGDTLGAGLGIPLQYTSVGCVDTAGYTGTWVDSIYYDTSFCSKLITSINRMENGPFLIDTCYDYFEPFFGNDQYGEGIGLKYHYFSDCYGGNFYCEEVGRLLFYKKGNDSCGLRPFIPLPSGMMEPDADNYIKISPNPFAFQTKIEFPEEQINSIISITNILGEEVQRSVFNGRTYIVTSGELSDGIYYFSITDKRRSFVKKLIIQR